MQSCFGSEVFNAEHIRQDPVIVSRTARNIHCLAMKWLFSGYRIHSGFSAFPSRIGPRFPSESASQKPACE
jgi:hypothetical protein